MKNLQSRLFTYQLKIAIGMLMLYAVSCTNPVDEVVTSEPLPAQENLEMEELMQGLIFDSNIIVENGSSIQEAIKVASPGDAIYIEPGIYREQLFIDKPDLKLIGLSDAPNNQVIIENPNAVDGITMPVQGKNLDIRNVNFQNYLGAIPQNQSTSSSRISSRRHSLNMTRTALMDGISHYTFEVCVGDGPYEVVRLHRVVREKRAHRPYRSKGAVFMIHGGLQDFDDIFFTAGNMSPDINAQTSSPVYLAANGIDVWGIDLAWTLVPQETSDFSFMEDWGVERDVDHTLKAMSIARIIRGFTGQGFGRLNLLGFSYGVPVAYAAAGMETQQHWLKRDIKGLIPVEAGMKFDPADEASRNSVCDEADGLKGFLDAGIFENSQTAILAFFGNLAITAPDDDSPFIPGLSNFQAGIAVGANPGATPPAPLWHFTAGDFNESGIPEGLLYTDPARWFNLIISLAAYMPHRPVYEFRACQCDEVDVTIDDYLDQISVPILYLGAGGGFGSLGDYTASLTASMDVTNYTVNLQAEEDRLIDFGHADMFMAEDASELVWEMLRDWLVDHNNHNL